MTTPVPILQTGTTLIASIQEELADNDILNMQCRILNMVVDRRSTGVIIDVSSLGVIDSFGARTLINIANAVKLRGGNMVIVGIQPEVALSMVLLGLTLDTVHTALDLDDGIATLTRMSK